MTIALPGWLSILVFAAILAAALWKGGPTERIGAVAILAGWIGTELLIDKSWANPQIGVLIVDLVVLALLVGLALRSDRYWPLGAAGFQLLGVLTHAARVLDAGLGAWAYITAGIIWSYLVVFALAFGTWGAWRERRQLAKAGLAAAPGATRL